MANHDKGPKAIPIDAWIMDQLADPEMAAAYLNSVLEDGDISEFLVALRLVAKARKGGVAGVARDTGIGRVTLTRGLTEEGNPAIRNVEAILEVSGLRLAIQPKKKARRRTAQAAG